MIAHAETMSGYFPIRLEVLASNRELPFPLFLYFEANRHRIKWKAEGDRLSPEDARSYRARGLSSAWIREKDRSLVRDFILGSPIRTGEGTRLAMLLADPTAMARLCEEARQLLAILFEAKSAAEQDEAHWRTRAVLIDLLAAIHSPASRMVRSLFRVAEQFPEIEHAPRVAVLATLLFLSFERDNPIEAAEIALAGVVHDLGHLALPDRTSPQPHVTEGAKILESTLPGLLPHEAPRIIRLVAEHHEFLDGSGYPKGLREPQLAISSQLLSLAELLETACSDSQGGTKRTLREALQELHEAQAGRAVRGRISSEILVPLFQWTRVHPAVPGSG